MPVPHISTQLKSAVAALKSGQMVVALDGFSNILATAPQHAETRKRLARAVKEASQPPQLTVAFLISLFQKGDLAALDTQLQGLLQTHPLSPALWGLQGALEKTRRNKAEALRAFRFASMLEPESPTAQNNLGLALHDNTQLEAAVDCFQRAIQLKPSEILACRRNQQERLMPRSHPSEKRLKLSPIMLMGTIALATRLAV